jgi:hypothetical protein
MIRAKYCPGVSGKKELQNAMGKGGMQWLPAETAAAFWPRSGLISKRAGDPAENPATDRGPEEMGARRSIGAAASEIITASEPISGSDFHFDEQIEKGLQSEWLFKEAVHLQFPEIFLEFPKIGGHGDNVPGESGFPQIPDDFDAGNGNHSEVGDHHVELLVFEHGKTILRAGSPFHFETLAGEIFHQGGDQQIFIVDNQDIFFPTHDPPW